MQENKPELCVPGKETLSNVFPHTLLSPLHALSAKKNNRSNFFIQNYKIFEKEINCYTLSVNH